METSRGIWAMVACLIEDHAAEAVAVAERRFDTVAADDPDGEFTILWAEVLAATREFFRATPRIGERLH
ncbi:hypothetical protein [Arenibaculum pallidiluteum]|uniref:hypothetical protein n=1 Tax=Arenibaculum pallidiluteum TaxID=2812559 RepID=UPI001A97CDB2|nr:hypothetical protein [Arenibaculum pallidiluteum]